MNAAGNKNPPESGLFVKKFYTFNSWPLKTGFAKNGGDKNMRIIMPYTEI